ncbi:CHAT domain-containing protein, partial [Chaetomium sp. MPI-SDFR-AT-0129]
RVWWIGVGLLAHFPFHAAGCYGGDTPGESAMDVVNSTYVPTLKSLLYAREKRAALADTAHAKACFVAMETTPGYPRLDGVENEARLIQAAFSGDCVSRVTSVTTLVHPTAAQVADHIGHCDVFHLACHAESDLTNPSRSRLILARTDPDGRGMERPDELFVEDIMRRSSSAGAAAGIAFLRACYSADNPAVGLSDEAIHLASAFHLAGFNHVLATLWSTRNNSCRAVAEKFYMYLFQGAQEPTHRSAAVAFHRAVNDLREDSWKNPLLWASFVHVG